MSSWERAEPGTAETEAFTRRFAWAEVRISCSRDGIWFLDAESLGMQCEEVDAVGRQEAKTAALHAIERRARELFAAVEGASS